MKGRIGGTATVESPMKGVVAPTPTPPRTLGSNVIAAVKRRKRGGAVADSGGKVEGKMAMARLDKPKRARGGEVKDDRFPSTPGIKDAMKRMDSDPALKKMPDSSISGYPSKMGNVLGSKVHSGNMKPQRACGGKVGADSKPLTSANREKPARGHSTGGNLD